MELTIATLLPSMYRPARLKKTIKSLLETAPRVDIIAALEKDDAEGLEIAYQFCTKVVVCEQYHAGCAYAWNAALKAAPSYDIYTIAADDVIFMSNWFENAMSALDKLGGSGLIGFGGDRVRTEYADHYMMTRDFIVQYHGGVAAVPHYSSWCVDTEAVERARKAKKYIKAKDAIVEHNWNGYDESDLCYSLGKSRRSQNKKLYYQRMFKGFPDDFPPIIYERVTA